MEGAGEVAGVWEAVGAITAGLSHATNSRATLIHEDYKGARKAVPMANLTISLDESIVRKARIRAIHEGTSVSAKVREFLAQYAGSNDTPAPTKLPHLPVFQGGNGLHSGIDPSSNKSMFQALEE